MKKLTKMLLSTALLVASLAAQADPVTVDYDVNFWGSLWGTGSFSGSDTNADGLISLGELNAFNFDSVNGIYTAKLTDLSSFGDYNVATNTWLSNGSGWGHDGIAYFSWNNDALSVNTKFKTVSTKIAADTVNKVPEPGSLALIGVGLVGLYTTRKRKI